MPCTPCTPARAFFIWMHAFLSSFFVKQILEIFTFEGGCLVFNYLFTFRSQFKLSIGCLRNNDGNIKENIILKCNFAPS